MDSTLVEYEKQFDSLTEAIESVVSGLAEEDLQWRPGEGRWSIVQCFEHLNSGWMVLPKLDRKIGEARERGILGSGPFRTKFLGQIYIRAIEPPVRFRVVKSPVKFRPRASPPSSEVVPKILSLQKELIQRIRASDGLDVGAITLSSPITRRFRMTLGQWFAFLAAHERRHVWQAKQVKAQMAIDRAS